MADDSLVYICARLAALRKTGRVIETEQWLLLHAEHGGIRVEDVKHPSGLWVRRVCACGAAHTGLRDTTGSAP